MDNKDKAAPKKKWNSQREGFQESLKYLQGRMQGKIKSLKTPWAKFNDAMTDGIEWNTLNVIGGRPASGKTLIVEQIVRESFPLNPGENFRVLQFQFEMLARTSAIREYSSIIGKSYKHLCSADGKLSDYDLQRCYDYAKEKIKYPIDVVEKPCTIDEFKEIIRDYMLFNAQYDSTGNMIFPKVLITIDHSLLFKKAPYEKDKQDMLNNLGEALTLLKRQYPIAFILLSQLNRNIDNPERSEDGKYGNYVLESDIFGSDAILQHADNVIGINRPAKQKIRYYGPDRYVIEDDRVLVLHFLKCRNGDTRLSFFRAEFEKMMIVEMITPPQQEKRIQTK
jgi:replicative DNA helicase